MKCEKEKQGFELCSLGKEMEMRIEINLKWSHYLFLSFDLINMVTMDFIFIMAMRIEIFFTMFGFYGLILFWNFIVCPK